MNDLVSIITPMYNSQKYIEEMLKSVINQSYSNWELIIVDDCSIDDSCKIVEKYSKFDKRIKLIKQKKNKGPAESRNIAIKISKGRYIAFLDSDDLWHKKKLEVQINYMLDKSIALTCTSYEMVSEDFSKSYGIFRVKNKIKYSDMLKKNYFSCDTVVVDKYKVNNIFMENFEKHEDYVTWLKYLKETEFAYGIDKVLAYYRISNNSRSSNKFSNIKPLFKIYYNIEELGIIKTIKYLLLYCINAILKYKVKLIK
ncbi:glycosyltransferase family 2 protein [Clostridium perfringens]